MLEDIVAGYMALEHMRSLYWDVQDTEGVVLLTNTLCAVGQIMDLYNLWPGNDMEEVHV